MKINEEELSERGDAVQRVELWTVASLMQVQFPGMGGDFPPSQLSVQTLLRSVVHPQVQLHALTAVLVLEDRVVHVRVPWIMKTIKHPACTMGWVVQLSQLAFPGESKLNYLQEESKWDNTDVKKKKRERERESKKATILIVRRYKA